jgi:hypothetical protein
MNLRSKSINSPTLARAASSTTNLAKNTPKPASPKKLIIVTPSKELIIVTPSSPESIAPIKAIPATYNVSKPNDTMATGDEQITLKTINDSIKTSNMELRADFTKLRADIHGEIKTTTDAYDAKIENVKQLITNEALVRHDELEEFWQAHKDDMRDEIDAMNVKLTTETKRIDALSTKVDSHDTRIEELEFQLAQSNTKWAQLERQLEELASVTNTKFLRVQAGVDEARKITNDVESHGRRWAIRILGLPAPTYHPEEIPEAKLVVLKLFKDYLNISNIGTCDIDCAHRANSVRLGKQTLLVRFFRREIVDLLVKARKMLAGKGIVILEDTTYLNRTLINDLKKCTTMVENSWNAAGAVWAKLKNSDKKLKVSINDNINFVLTDHLSKFPKIAKLTAPASTKPAPTAGSSSATSVPVTAQPTPTDGPSHTTPEILVMSTTLPVTPATATMTNGPVDPNPPTTGTSDVPPATATIDETTTATSTGLATPGLVTQEAASMPVTTA